MVIEFAPKPQLPLTVEKSTVLKKSVKADPAEVAKRSKPIQTKVRKSEEETAAKNGELF